MSGDGPGRRRPNRGRPNASPSSTSRGPQPTQARLLAVRVMDRVQRVHAYSDLSLHHYLVQSALSAADRALATELVYGTLRWRGRIDYVLDQVLDQPIAKLEPPVASALRVGAYQLMFTDRIPASAAVDESVRCIRALGLERATGLVNAVLRRLSREHADIALPALEDDPQAHLVHALSFPPWIAERFIAEFGPEDAAALALASNSPPPFTVRTNTTRVTRDELLAELLERFPEAAPCEIATQGLSLGRRGDPSRDPAFLAGRFTVQDQAAQLVVELLDPQPGDLVLDACSAPGGKTAAIAERLAGRGGVLALDRHARRLGLVARAIRRLGLEHVHTLERDASKPLANLPREWAAEIPGCKPVDPSAEEPLEFDRALVDAPCSGLGTLRRNPDARWRVGPEAPAELAKLQLSILEHTAATLRPGGCVVYSTCTVLPEENEGVVNAFLASRPEFQLAPRSALPLHLAPVLSDEGFLRCLPHVHDTDGFFAARLERTG
jgi:16S rRNA (cytosine967-C5)-methyltransferase